METNRQPQESTLYIQGTVSVPDGLSPDEFAQQLTEWLTTQGSVFMGNMGPYVESQSGVEPETGEL